MQQANERTGRDVEDNATRCYGRQCPTGMICDPADGSCVTDLCTGVTCQGDEVCDPATGECGADPCGQIQCPDGLTCKVSPRGATCVDPNVAAEDEWVTAGGGGGCATTDGSGLAFAGLLLGAVALRRRRR